jgi:hypothetical protein
MGLFFDWIFEEGKKPASIAHADIDRWLKSVDGLAKDLKDLKNAKDKTKGKMDQIGKKFKGNVPDKPIEKSPDKSIDKDKKEKLDKIKEKDIEQKDVDKVKQKEKVKIDDKSRERKLPEEPRTNANRKVLFSKPGKPETSGKRPIKGKNTGKKRIAVEEDME